MRLSRFLPALAAAAMLLPACHNKPPESAPVVTPTPAPPPPDGRDQQRIRDSIAAAQEAARRRDAANAAARARDDSIARANAAARDQAAMRAALTATIHFDFDKSDLRDDARAILDAMLPILTANPGITIRIAGHTDEKGSTEYNLALGQRRAVSAKRYLTAHGVAAARLETISYGLERPVAMGHDDAAMAQNRRDEFEITAGASGPLLKPRH